MGTIKEISWNRVASKWLEVISFLGYVCLKKREKDKKRYASARDNIVDMIPKNKLVVRDVWELVARK
jgi:hypothetical protein